MPPVNRLYRVCFIVLLGAVGGCGPTTEAKTAESAGLSFHSETFRGVPFTVSSIDLERAKLQLFWKDSDGVPFVNFAKLDSWLEGEGRTLVVATNSGIFAEDRTPLGLHVADGKVLRPLNAHPGSKSNFALKPNGVFYIDSAGAHIRTTEAYAAAPPEPTLAVQSGPLLVLEDALHPKFNLESTSVHFRNGIGVVSPKRIVIVISDLPVNFHTFASFFKDRLNCKNALYLDGSLSGLYAPAIGRTLPGIEYVGILGVTAPVPGAEGQGQ